MFERFTDRGRKVMELASHEAQRFNHKCIDTEHILLGLVKEGSVVGAAVLEILDVDINKLCLEVEKLVKSRPDMVTMDKLPHTPRAKKVIEFAIEEARSLNHKYIATEHLWLGLLRDTDSVAVKTLLNLGVNCEQVRNEILNMFNKGSACCDKAKIQGFSERARKILAISRREAWHFNHECIDTEHILLGFIKEGSGVGMIVLKNLNVDIMKLRLDVEKLMIKGPDMVAMDELQMEQRAKKVIEYAIEEAKTLNSNYLGTEHLLLGLLHENKGSIAFLVLTNLGLTCEQVRNEILNLFKAGNVCGGKCNKAATQGFLFSDRARKILSLANQEAQHFNHECIDTEHILLGFIKEGSGVGMTVLKNLNVDINKLRRDVEKLMIKGPDMVTMGKFPHTPFAKKVIEYAIEEAKTLNSNYIGSEHLLLGLMYETRGSVSAQVLKKHGLQYEQVRNEILRVLGK